MTSNYVDSLLTQIEILTALGTAVMPVMKDPNNPKLATGKVPSYINENGTTTLLSGRDGWRVEYLKNQISLAQKYDKPIGIAIQPPSGLVIIDLDVDNYSGGQAELMSDYQRILGLCPDLAKTRTEKTTSGGLHIYVRVEDLEDWRQETGSLRKNLTTSLGGTHRGEVLSTNSVCIAAPSYEKYRILDGTPEDRVVTVPSLASISIFPIASQAIRATTSQPVPIHTPSANSGVLLRDLLGIKALGVLNGEYAYSDPNMSPGDRSLQLTGFAKEAFGCENLAKQHGVLLSETADDLIKVVVQKFNLTGKARRILVSLEAQRQQYTAGNPEAVLKTLGIVSSHATGKKKPNITPDLAEAEALKALGTVREQIRTGNIVLGDGRVMSRDDIELMYMEFSRTTPFHWNKMLAKDAVQAIGRANQYDHIQEDFIALAKSTTPLPDALWNQLDQLLFGISDPIAAMFMPKYLVGAVNRLMNPGCSYVATPTLLGGQGIGKSASAKVLFGSQYVVDELGYSLSKDDISRSHRFFCIELAEVDGITGKGDRERLKAFLTRSTDVYRPPYGASEIECPRRFVFWASSNGNALNDPTGNRRFVSIDLSSKTKANPIPLAQIEKHRAAIWARAFYEYEQGFGYELDASEQANVNQQNELFTIGDSWVDQLARKLSLDPKHTCISVDEAFRILDIPSAQQSPNLQKRLREALASLDYQAAKVTMPNGQRLNRFTRSKGQKQIPVDVERCLPSS
jgi:hypothetical protein